MSLPIEAAPLPGGLELLPFGPAVARSCRELMNSAYGQFGDAPEALESWYGRLIADEEYDPALVWVASDGAAIVGFCHGWTSSFIKDLVVAPRWRGRGLGAALVTLAMESFRERGAPSLALKTDENNVKAIALYRRLGFVVAERFPG